MKVLSCSLIFGLILTATLGAQTSTWTLKWDQGTNMADVQNSGKAVFTDGVLLTSDISCSQASTGAVVTCQTTFPALTQAPHVFRVRSVLNGVERETQATIDPTKGPPASTSIRITITTVTP